MSSATPGSSFTEDLPTASSSEFDNGAPRRGRT
jgi:hypothetical protein